MKLPLTLIPTNSNLGLKTEAGQIFDSHSCRLENPDGAEIATVRCQRADGDGDYPQIKTKEEAEEYAKYILTAVNSHAELLALVRIARNSPYMGAAFDKRADAVTGD